MSDWRDPAERHHEYVADMTAQVVWEREQAELIAGLKAEIRGLQARLDSLRPMLERMGVTFSEEAPT